MRAGLASLRYVLALLISTQRWAAPAIVLIGLIAWIWVTPPVGIDTIRITLLALFALASWLGYAVGTVEEPGQELISISCRGSLTGLLLAKWSTAVILAVSFPLLMLAGSYAAQPPEKPTFSDPQAAASLLALIGIAILGTALGALLASLLPGRPGWSAAILILVALAQASSTMPVGILAAALPPSGPPLPAVPPPVTADFFLGLALTTLIALALLTAARVVHRPAR